MFGVNPYSPYGYAPFNNSQDFNAMNQMYSPKPQPVQTGPDWITVATIKQAEQVNVQPGGKAWIMIQNEPVFALRTADQMGLVTTSYYRFEKIDPSAMESPSTEYVTRSEFEKFVSSLSSQKVVKKEDETE